MIGQDIDLNDYLYEQQEQEAFKLLNINIGLNQKAGKLKLILIISLYPGEGKTSVAINLAFAAAKAGNKVLYVDADLRKSGDLNYEGDGGTKGLTDINEDMEVDEVIRNTSLYNLKYVTIGTSPVDPVVYLHSKEFDRFLQEASQKYDLVLIDSIALENYADSSIIASKVEGVLIVARYQKTRYKDIERIKWQMDNVGAHLIGIVINRVKRRDYKHYFILRNHDKNLAREADKYTNDMDNEKNRKLAALNAEIAEMVQINEMLKNDIANLNSVLLGCQKAEEAISGALTQAKVRAEAIEEEAKKKADEIQEVAETELITKKKKLEELQQYYTTAKHEFGQILDKYQSLD